MTFRDECNEWLNPLGYNINIIGAEDRCLIFSHDSDIFKPSIQCFNRLDGNKHCILVGGNLKMFLTLSTTELMFKHPEIQKFIDTIAHYAKVCEENPPF